MDIERYEEDRRKLVVRIEEVKQLLQETQDPRERMRQADRLRILRGMYKDVLDNLERLRPPEDRHRHKPPRKTVSLDGFGYDFLERVRSAAPLMAGEMDNLNAHQSAALRLVILRGLDRLSPRQREFFAARMAGKSLAEIAREAGVQKSTVSRVIGSAERCLTQVIGAHAFLAECISPDGVDLLRLAERAGLLTPRQREMLFFLLTDGINMTDIAAIVGRNRSTVCRSAEAITRGFSGVCLDITGGAPRKITRQSWPGRTETEIAAALGMPKGCYYRLVCRDQRVGPWSRYTYEVLVRRGKMSARETAEDMGIRADTVRKIWRRYPEADVSALPPPKPYTPGKSRYAQGETSLRAALATLHTGGSTIGDAVSAQVYAKMLQISGGEANVGA